MSMLLPDEAQERNMRHYRLTSATVAVQHDSSRPAAIFIPPGTVVQVADDLSISSGLVDVYWNGKTVQAFAVDLLERGERVKVRSAGK